MNNTSFYLPPLNEVVICGGVVYTDMSERAIHDAYSGYVAYADDVSVADFCRWLKKTNDKIIILTEKQFNKFINKLKSL